jgi:CP family cyanate transporter-like MFS transporter
LLVITLPVGVGLGLAGALLPGAVKERLPHRPAFATGIYVLGLTIGAAAGAALAVPLAHVAGGWRGSLAAFSLATAGLLVAWLWTTRREARLVRGRAVPARVPFRSGLAWLLALGAALNASVFYGLIAWLPDVYVERGWSKAAAGLLIGVANVAALPALLVTWWADRRGSRRAYLATSALFMVGTLLGITLLPGGAWAWAALFGASNTVFFALILTLPLDLGSRPDEVGAITALMLGAGYSLAGLAPFVLGAVRDATGGFAAPLWLLVAAAAALVLISLRLTARRLGGGARSQPAPA